MVKNAVSESTDIDLNAALQGALSCVESLIMNAKRESVLYKAVPRRKRAKYAGSQEYIIDYKARNSQYHHKTDQILVDVCHPCCALIRYICEVTQ